jgi:hypothetical protein
MNLLQIKTHTSAAPHCGAIGPLIKSIHPLGIHTFERRSASKSLNSLTNG